MDRPVVVVQEVVLVAQYGLMQNTSMVVDFFRLMEVLVVTMVRSTLGVTMATMEVEVEEE